MCPRRVSSGPAKPVGRALAGAELTLAIVTAAASLTGCTSTVQGSAGSTDSAGGPGESKPEVLYSLTGDHMEFVNADGGANVTLVVDGVDSHSIWFTDRPYRESGVISTERLVQEWAPGATFDRDAPNAALVLHEAAEVGPGETADTLVVEMLDAAYDAATHRFTTDLRVLSDEQLGSIDGNLDAHADKHDKHWPTSAGAVSLFIDTDSLAAVTSPDASTTPSPTPATSIAETPSATASASSTGSDTASAAATGSPSGTASGSATGTPSATTSSASASATDSVVLGPPQSLTAPPPRSGSTNLTWQPPYNAGGFATSIQYKVEVSSDGTSFAAAGTVNGDSSGGIMRISGITSTKYYRVTAVLARLTSAPSSVLAVSPSGASTPTPSATATAPGPTVPTAVTASSPMASSPTSGRATITWQNSTTSDGLPISYTVEMSTDGGFTYSAVNGAVITTTGSHSSATIGSLAVGKLIYFRVRASTTAGTSNPSSGSAASSVTIQGPASASPLPPPPIALKTATPSSSASYTVNQTIYFNISISPNGT